MDDIVKEAMVKWPNVPDCFGWLGLDARGQWWLRDGAAQRVGPFAGPGASADSKGTLLRHEKLLAFIQRNYEHDAQGRWFFQNGPQRVYAELELAPLVLRQSVSGAWVTHCGQEVEPVGCWADELGHVYLQTPLGLGVVYSQDVTYAAEAVEAGRWVVQACRYEAVPEQFGFIRSPAQLCG